MSNQEIEVRFLEIDVASLAEKLAESGALDKGENLLEEIIYYDHDLNWRDSGRFVRLRKSKGKISLSYKHHHSEGMDGVEEIEFSVGDWGKAALFLEKIGLVPFRRQQKKRHSYVLDGVSVDIDTWPRIPTYVELEGGSEAAIRRAAGRLGLNWEEAVFESARTIIEERYHIPVGAMSWFTFDKFE